MSRLRAALVLLFTVASILVHALPLLAVAVFKALLPLAPVRRACNAVLARIAESWIGVNNAMIDGLTSTRFHVGGDEGLLPDGHYLVLANHQSWVDILVLQKVFNRRIPLLRFFLKRQLFWVPVLGLAWWALDFPFMGRYTHRQVAKNPELGRRDMEATRRACAKFRDMPVSMMNFVEGTRFTPEKHAAQASPFRHLLKPRAGGVAFVVDAMGEGLHALLDVTIAYPGGRPTMFDLMAGRIPEVRVHLRQRPIPTDVAGGRYQEDRAARARFQQWLNRLWEQKDADMERMLRG
ncbi:acyltransferase [Luteimonas granuli]|uniref:Acyltransferase n=1 Tax=Luteimonas granuli TaxID=1176533 RepID=A0A518N6P0_9GAMM|nr:acyltransferase [Luteimonas granuli]QDW67594.1 acyltransferase [Luteimonas granuli]